MTWLAGLFTPPDISIFHDFHRPPYGGGNQFLLALRRELRRRGLRVESNSLSPKTRACLFNSFNFDPDRLRNSRLPKAMVHRVDGPIGRYRDADDSIDRRILALNEEFASATIFQSQYSFEAHVAMGMRFRAPRVILNTVDPALFYPKSPQPGVVGRRVRIITTSWSTNPNKGAATYKWLEEHLDWDRFEFTFVGRTPIHFERIRTIAPVGSEGVARLLRSHDVYIIASLHESCSNALLEALACGLPAIYARSGGNTEIVGDGGLAFDTREEITDLLDRLVHEYDQRRAAIAVPSLASVADGYLRTMGLG